MIEKQITIDLWKKFTEPLDAVQYEVDARELIVTLVSGGLPVNISAASVVFYAIKPDGEIIYNDFTIIDGAAGKASYVFTGQTCAAYGRLRCWIDIITTESHVRTREFFVNVEKSEDSTNAIESTSEFTALEVALGDVADVKADIASLGTRMTAVEKNVITGDIKEWPYNRLPPYGGWLWTDQAYSRATYPALFNWLCYDVGAVTISIASPGVVTLASHGFVTGDQVYLTTSGALPTGLAAETLYYVIYVNANTFRLATSRANAIAGTAINTSGTQSGTHHLRDCPHGNGNGSTTFNTPAKAGRMPVGQNTSDADFKNVGKTGGNKTHTQTVPEMAPHAHKDGNSDGYNWRLVTPASSGGVIVVFTNDGDVRSTETVGSGQPMDIMNPYAITKYIIKT